jgi:hypothetical protein
MATVNNHQHNSDHSTYTVNMHGSKITVTVTAFASVVENWIKTTFILEREDYEWRALLTGIAIDPKADTLQLCTGNRCLIFQLAHADSIPQNLRDFLLNRHCGFIRFKNPKLRNMLKSSKHGLEIHRDPLDLSFYREEYDHDSVEEIIYKSLGLKVELREEIRMSNWSEECLSDDQVAYACVQTHCAYLMGYKLHSWELCI